VISWFAKICVHEWVNLYGYSLVYVAYSTRTASTGGGGGASAGQYKTSVCAVGLPRAAEAAPAPEAN
jgi:hypothetical protein